MRETAMWRVSTCRRLEKHLERDASPLETPRAKEKLLLSKRLEHLLSKRLEQPNYLCMHLLCKA
jgi:hypothetical protein